MPAPRSIAAAWDEIIKAGWLSALVAEKDDGLGLGMFDLALALEETGKQIVMTPLVESRERDLGGDERDRRGPSGAGSHRIEDRRAGDDAAGPALRPAPPA